MKLRCYGNQFRFLCFFVWVFTCPNLFAEKQPRAPRESVDICQSGPLAGHPLPLPDDDKIAALNGWLQEKSQHLAGAGLSVGFSFRDYEWMGSYGNRDVERGLPITPDTSFRIASVSKIMTAIAVLQEVERGRIDLNADIRTYVPSFPKKKWPVRIRDLLGHLGGISHYRNCRRECYLQTEHSTKEALSLFQNWPLTAKPGEHYLYTSYGYNLLAAAVEKSSRTTFETYLRKNIFQRAQMHVSHLERNSRPPKERAHGYELLASGLQPSRRVNISSRFGGGAVRSTQREMLRFGRALLTEELLSKDMTSEMQRSMSTTSGILTDYGMGIGVMPQSGRYVLAHAGGQPETSTYFVLIPAEGLVVFLAANVEEQAGWLRELAEHIVSCLLGDGSYRRQVTGKDEVHALTTRAYFRTMSHGVAWFTRFGELYSDDPGALLGAFRHLKALFDEERIAFAPAQARADESHAVDPLGGSTYPIAGSYMASLVAQHFGAARLRTYAVEGPFQFALDYEQACQAIECPTGFQLPTHLLERLEDYQSEWKSANTLAIRHLDLHDSLSPAELRAQLEPTFANKSAYPDLSGEILERAHQAFASGQHKQAQDFLVLAQDLYPNAAKVVFASAEQKLKAGDFSLAEQGFRSWSRLSTQTEDKKRKQLQRLKHALKKEGNHRGAEVLHGILKHFARSAKTQDHPEAGLESRVAPASQQAKDVSSASLAAPKDPSSP